jgi:hypothetical protein
MEQGAKPRVPKCRSTMSRCVVVPMVDVPKCRLSICRSPETQDSWESSDPEDHVAPDQRCRGFVDRNT